MLASCANLFQILQCYHVNSLTPLCCTIDRILVYTGFNFGHVYIAFGIYRYVSSTFSRRMASKHALSDCNAIVPTYSALMLELACHVDH